MTMPPPKNSLLPNLALPCWLRRQEGRMQKSPSCLLLCHVPDYRRMIFSKSTRRPFLAVLWPLSLFGNTGLSNNANLGSFCVVTAWILGYFSWACLLLPGMIFRWVINKNFRPEQEALPRIAVTHISAIYYIIRIQGGRKR